MVDFEVEDNQGANPPTSDRRESLPAPGTGNAEEVMRHRIIAGVNDFVIHRKDEDVVKKSAEQFFQGGASFAIYVTRFARRRGMDLRFQGGRSKNEDTVVT